MANVVLIFVALAPNMFHHNNVGVTYAGYVGYQFQSGTNKICTNIFYGNASLYDYNY
jgi:hypothetical protein